MWQCGENYLLIQLKYNYDNNPTNNRICTVRDRDQEDSSILSIQHKRMLAR